MTKPPSTGENLDILELARQAKALHAKSVWHGEDSDDAATVLFALASAVETLTREKDQLRYDFVDAAVAEAQLKEQAIKRAEAAEARLAEVEKICHDPYCQKNFDSVGLWQDKPQHNWADCARITVVALREQAGRMAGALRDVNVALQSGRAGRLMTAEEVRQHDAIHAIIGEALAPLRKAEGE